MNLSILKISALFAITICHVQAQYPWQKNYAEMLPTGEMKYAPEPRVFQPGKSIRYIDFEKGDNANPGDSKEKPWKHHPWDPSATGNAATEDASIDTYVFKGGVIYRGTLRPGEKGGQKAQSIQLTSDPTWGKGPARFYGSDLVKGWERKAHAAMPPSENIWSAEVDFLPRTLWAVDPKSDSIKRFKLARMNNWGEPDANDPMSEWPVLEQPEWWKNKNVIQVDGKDRHLGVDKKNFAGIKAEDVEGATIWSEWGIVMGSPYPSRVEKFDAEKSGVAFRGPWTYEMSEKIITGNRYYLENKPQWLDEDYEFWVDRMGKNKARIYLRLPTGTSPEALHIEAGRHSALIKSNQFKQIEISGFHFRFTNIHWDYDLPRWGHEAIQDAVFRLKGGADDIKIHHNIFEHVVMPVRINAGGDGKNEVGIPIGSVRISDNQMSDTDHGAIVVSAEAKRETKDGTIESVEILRNNMQRIGWRIISGEHGHAVNVNFPTTSLMAGNFLHRIAGWGLAVFGGKASGHAYEASMSRHIIMQNRIEDVLLKSNDWGGIETWQGGPHFVFNNLVINPRGYKNWIKNQNKADRIPAFGHAYYLDGSFKNHLFNNIAIGLNNTPNDKNANNTALQNIHSFENTFAQNTFYKFGEVTRQQNPVAGRVQYLSNIIDDASQLVFRHADPKDIAPDPNASHYTQGGQFDYGTLAYDRNVLHDIKGKLGVFEETGFVHPDLPSMREALQRVKALNPEVGIVENKPVLKDPRLNGDFTPLGGAIGKGTKFFVPWALNSVVGEWEFHNNKAEPGVMIDQHWNMLPYFGNREQYHATPRYPLVGVDADGANHVASPSEDWTSGAVRLDGKKGFYRISHASLLEPFTIGKMTHSAEERATVDIGKQDLLVEVIVKLDSKNGTLVRKMAGNGAGYALDVREGKLTFSAKDESGKQLMIRSAKELPQGQWLHIVAEIDRKKSATLFLDGKEIEALKEGEMLTGSLSNPGEFLVGGGPEATPLQGEIDFLRVARSTLADSRTTIGELYAWQFQGPQTRDFSGRPRKSTSDAGAIESGK